MLAQLDRWLDAPGGPRWVVVTGGPGMGKSAILAAWLARREATGARVPHHLIRRQVADWDQPEVIAASLAAQIEAAFPYCCDPDARPERRLIELLGRVSKQRGAARLVVVVDGLDETRAKPGENPLPRFLPAIVPAGVCFLCATRPSPAHLAWIEARGAQLLDLDGPRWAASNEAAVREFWGAAAATYRPPLPPEMIAAAIAHAEGNVLYAVMLHEQLCGVPVEERRADRIPRGLPALIAEAWARATTHESVRTGLGLLCAAREALSLDVLAELAAWRPEDRQHFVRDARPLLLEQPRAWAGGEAYRPRHEWVSKLLVEQLVKQLGATALRAHHATLARTLATWPPRSEPTERRYALRHALIHRAEAGAWASAWQLATDMSYWETKCGELGVHEAEADATWVAERCRSSGDAVIAARFADLARAIRRESHWLRVASLATTALLWNRLRRLGWRAEDLAQLQLPEHAPFLRVRHAARRESPALVRDLVDDTGWVTACAMTPDGRCVVSGSWDGVLKLWDLATGTATTRFEGHSGWVTGCAVTHDGRRVVSASHDRTLRIWDLTTGELRATLAGHTGSVTGCAVTRDGRVVSASHDRTLRVWDLATGELRATLEGHTAPVTGCAVTPEGDRMVSASHDHTLRVWDLASGQAIAILAGHTAPVTGCAMTSGGRILSTSEDRTLRLWDPASPQAIAILRGHAAPVTGCAVTSDGGHAVSASNDETLKLWDLTTGKGMATFEGHTDFVNACALGPDGRVVSASHDRTLKLWDLTASAVPVRWEGHTSRVSACAVTPDGQGVVSASHDRTLKLWDLATGRLRATLVGHTDRVTACAVTPDGQRVISGAWDRTLKLWDLATGGWSRSFEGHTGLVSKCVVTPDGKRVLSASKDRTLRLWELSTGELVTTLAGHADWVTACAVMPDGERALSASCDRTLKVWDLATGAHTTLTGHTDWVFACALTPDGRAVSASCDRTLKVWDLATGAHTTLAGHTDVVFACAVTPDGRRVISASDDRTLKVWDLATGACLLTHHGDAAFMSVEATQTTIIAGDEAGVVWFLDLPPAGTP